MEEVGPWSCLRQAQAILPHPRCCSSMCSETQDVSQLSQAQQKVLSSTQTERFLIHFRKQRFALYCHGKALYCHGKVTKRENATIPRNGKCNGKLYNNINKKTMANRCHFSHQKQDKKRGYLKNHLPKAYQLLLGIRGSNQTRHIKCRSRENYQSRYHVGQTRN